MDNITALAAANQQCARKVIRDTDLEAIWRSVGAEPHLVGSLRTNLLMTHRDIDFHIYSSPLRIEDSFAAIARLAQNSRIRRIEAVLTDETRTTILRLKYQTPETVKIMGIEYYQAVLRDGVRTYAEFEAWCTANPATGIIEWMP